MGANRVVGAIASLGLTVAVAMLAYAAMHGDLSAVDSRTSFPSSRLAAIGAKVNLPARDYFGEKMPSGRRRLELWRVCPSCTAGTSSVVFAKTHDKHLPLIVISRERYALDQIPYRAKQNVFRILESDRRILPENLWLLNPFSVELDADNTIVDVYPQADLTMAAKSVLGVSK